MRDAWGVDTQDSVDAVTSIMQNLGATTDEAVNAITFLSQRGVVSPDVIDSITEYSTQIRAAGGDVGNLISLLDTGFQSGGVLATDKALDLFKEFRIRVSEGGKEARTALNALGLDASQILNDIANGNLKIVDAFDIVNQELTKVTDETQRFVLGQALLGTQFEDLGDQAVAAMSATRFSVEDAAGSLDILMGQYDTLTSVLQGYYRKLEVSLAPLINSLKKYTRCIFANILCRCRRSYQANHSILKCNFRLI